TAGSSSSRPIRRWPTGWSRAGRRRSFSHLETGKPGNRYVLADLADRLLDHLADGPLVILGPGLVEQDLALVKIVQLSLHDLFHYRLGLLLVTRLSLEDGTLPLEHVGRDVFAAKIAWIGRGDVHGNLVCQLAELLVAGDEVTLAVDLDQHPELLVVVHICFHDPLARGPGGLGAGFGHALLAQPVLCLLEIATSRLQGALGVHHAGARRLPQHLDLICCYRHVISRHPGLRLHRIPPHRRWASRRSLSRPPLPLPPRPRRGRRSPPPAPARRPALRD